MIVCHVGQWERWNAFSLLCLKDKKTTLFSFMGKTRQDKKMELIFGMFEFIHYDLCSWKHCTLYSLNSHIENQELQHSRPPLVAAWQGGRNDSEDSTPSDCKNFAAFLLSPWSLESADGLEIFLFNVGELQKQRGAAELLICHLPAGSYPALRYNPLQLSQSCP